MSKLSALLISFIIPGSAFAGPLDTLRSSAGAAAAAATAPVAVTAPASLSAAKGTTEGDFCFERSADSMADETRLPRSFCFSKLTLERGPDGGLTMDVVSASKDIKGGKAEYIFENGSLKYARVKVYEFFNEIYDSVIFVYAPVYPNGNLIPGAEVKAAGKAGIQPPDGDWMYEDFVYSKPKPPQPPAVNGSCFLRAPQEWADEAGMPAKFCVKGLALVRENDGSLAVTLAGEISGRFPASYVSRGDKTFVQAAIFDHEDGGMSGYSGRVTLLAPVHPNGDIAAKGQMQVEARAGYNWDVYHSDWQYQPVKYYTVAD